VTSRRAPDGGMTLVEIMITMILSSIIGAATFMFFAGQQRIYETQTQILNIQQNLWAAMEVVARYTRGTGTGMYGCVKPASYFDPSANGTRLRSTNPSPGPLTLPVSSESLDTRPQTGIRAYDPATNGMQWVPPLWIVNNDAGTSPTDAALHVLAGTDVLTVALGNRSSGTDYDITVDIPGVTTTNPAIPIPLSGGTTASMFRPGEFVLLLKLPEWGFGADPPADDRGCAMFQVTEPVLAASLSHLSGVSGSIWNPTGNVTGLYPTDPATSTYEPNAYAAGVAGVRNFGQFTWITFFIQQVSAGSIPQLMMLQRHLGSTAAPQVLAEGIEDLQVSFACDTGSIANPRTLAKMDGELYEAPDDPAHSNDAARKTDEWWNNVPEDTLPATGTDGFCNLPTAIRITMVSRSLGPDEMIPSGSTNRPPDIEDHRQSLSAPTDRFRRRVLTTTVYPRNNKPQ
jgi:prepilin-type N-terminal cleavage/methylation domain-containing protein